MAIRDDVPEQDMVRVPKRSFRRNYNVDKVALKQLFDEYDEEKTGALNIAQLENLLV